MIATLATASIVAAFLRDTLRTECCVGKKGEAAADTTVDETMYSPSKPRAHFTHFTLYLKSLETERLASESFIITLLTAISKSSCVTWIRRSRSANIPASVHTALHSAPEAVVGGEGVGEMRDERW